MSNRREFLKQSMKMGAVTAVFPFAEAFGEEMLRDGSQNVDNPMFQPHAATEGDTFTVSMRHISAPTISPRRIVVPDVEGYKVLKGDFHIHTLFSDGLVMPKDRIVEAVENGLDVISITDHIEYRPYFSPVGKWKLNPEQANNYNLWYEEARGEAEKQNLILVRGAEVTKSTMGPGHLNVLFTTDNNPVAAAVSDWRKMLQTAADQGAFILWNHPGWEAPKSGGIEKGAPLRFTGDHEEILKKGILHGIEIFNHKEYYPVVSDWCNEKDLALFANSDVHESELNTYGIQNLSRPMNLILAKERTLESIREAFFAKRIVAWAADILWGRDPWLPALFKASVEMKTITPGTLELTNKSSLPVFISVGGAVIKLSKDVAQQVYCSEKAKTMTVCNWMSGMNQPMEIALNKQ
ncbi:MAG: PHP domain-containing protein [Bacteroidales bacterium]|jgi:hypothetical protein|nr:PHP domain-containing protein [Bacteroidales bacterium]